MIRDILLVAWRDFRQATSTRGFIITLLIVPVMIGISGFAATRLAPQYNVAYTLYDASGRYGPAVERRVEMDYQRDVLRNLTAYVDRWGLASVDPSAPWARKGAWASDAAVAQFMADGGADAAVRRLQPRLPQGAPPFKPATRLFSEVPTPAGVPTDRGPEAYGQAMAALLQGEVVTPDGKRQLGLAIYIPKDFGAPGAVVRAWTNGRYDGGLGNAIRQQLTADLRLGLLQASGLPADQARRIETVAAPIQVTDPPPGAGRNQVVARSVAPMALVYLLLISAITAGNMMLQGLVDERSNKLLEAVLACIKPESLMYGKLLGLGAVGLLVVSVWGGCGVGAALFAPGFLADVLKPSLTALAHPGIVAAMLFYFLSGYLVVSILFLAIGSVSDSMQDAQPYLMPVMMLVMLPVIFIIQATARTPDAPVVHLLSWIPLYTPFAMLVRMGSGVPLWEMAGTGVVLAVFMGLEFLMLGRLFRASLLSAGQPSRAELLARMLSPAR